MKRPDVVVVGGGIVGCAVAYSTTRAGLRTLILDRGGIAGGSSAACMGHLMMMPGPESMYRSSRRSLSLWKQFHREVGGFDMRECGCLWLGETEADMPLLEDIHADIAGFGDTGYLLDAGELRAREPALATDVAGAFYYPDDAVIFPMHAAGALIRAAMAGGAVVRHHTAVCGLRRAADGSVEAVETDRGVIETDTVINAAGVWAPEIAEMAGLPGVPIFPRRGDLAITMPQNQLVRHQMVEVGYLRSASGHVTDPEDPEPDPGGCALNVQPQGNGTLLIGSSRQFAGFDRRVNSRLLSAALARAARFVPAIADLQLVRTWAGLRPYTRDKLPIIGPVPGVPGLYMAGGHEGLGITLSMVTGELIAQAVCGDVPSLPLEPFAVGRFAEVVDG